MTTPQPEPQPPQPPTPLDLDLVHRAVATARLHLLHSQQCAEQGRIGLADLNALLELHLKN